MRKDDEASGLQPEGGDRPDDRPPSQPGEPTVGETDQDGPGASLRGALGGETARTIVIVVLLAALVLAFLQPALLLGARGAAVELYVDAVADPVATTTAEPLTITAEDVAYLNRIYTEQDLEVGYCGLIDGERRLRPWLAQLGRATETSLQISVRNCPTGAYPGLALVHTHPNGDARLTAADRESLGLEGVDFLCVQHGPIRAEAGGRTNRLRCYTAAPGTDGSGQLARVPVRVVA